MWRQREKLGSWHGGAGRQKLRTRIIWQEEWTLLLDIIELKEGISHRDFPWTFGNDDVKFRREVKSEDIYLSITVKAIRIE